MSSRDDSTPETEQFADRSEIEREAHRLEEAIKRQLADKATQDATHRFQDQNKWALGEDTWMPRTRRDYIRSGFVVTPSHLEEQFFAGQVTGWHLEFYPADRPTGILRIVAAGDTMLGRASHADVDLDSWNAAERGVSREHALLRPASHCLYIIDMGSTNGTFVNGLPLSRSSAYALHHNCVLTLGRLVFTLKIVHVGTGDLVDDGLVKSTPGSSPFIFTPSESRSGSDDVPTSEMPSRRPFSTPPSED